MGVEVRVCQGKLAGTNQLVQIPRWNLRGDSGSGVIGPRVHELPPVSVGILKVMTVGPLLGRYTCGVEATQVGSNIMAVEDEVHGVDATG